MWLVLENAKTMTTPSPRGRKKHECQSARGEYDGGKLMWEWSAND
jgi:hypothetical protein